MRSTAAEVGPTMAEKWSPVSNAWIMFLLGTSAMLLVHYNCMGTPMVSLTESLLVLQLPFRSTLLNVIECYLRINTQIR